MQRLPRADCPPGRRARRAPLIATADFHIYTDGSTSGNPGPSGWGAVILGEGRRREIGGHEAYSTNNRMELTAVIRALESVDATASISIHSDSAYVIDGITRYILKWKQNGFLTAAKHPVENRDLWEELDALSGSGARCVNYVKVTAHAGVAENERANDIAQGFSQRKKVVLQNRVHVPKPSAPCPAIPGGFVFPLYVALLNGRCHFFRTWDQCRTAVKGKKCRYKKCQSKEELAYIAGKWEV